MSRGSAGHGAELPDELAVLVERVGRSTVEIVSWNGRGLGAGVIWEGGIVITNAHVVSAGEAEVCLPGGDALPARVIALHESRDLAALQLRRGAAGLLAAEAGDSDALRPGELVLALGHPWGLRAQASLGVVHRASVPGAGGRRWIEADVRLAPGNSGGPLADARGRVVGINTMVAHGLALAVPSRAVSRFLRGARLAPAA
ncbi:MAG TPA: trypsin-like peptidase domain-containing protein [Gemmatimonadaceae bacterium]